MSKRQWFSLVKVLAPLVISIAAPKLTSVTDKLTDAIGEAEAMGGTSAEKLAHVKNIASDAADVVNAAKGHETVNKAALDASVEHAVNTVIAVTNLVHASAPSPDSTVK